MRHRFVEPEQIENLPQSSVIIAPTNYNFPFMREATIANTLEEPFVESCHGRSASASSKANFG